MHYEFTGETKTYTNGKRIYTLHRIQATKDISIYSVKKGDLGGWIEKESNLPGDCNNWVFGNAMVMGFSIIGGNVTVEDDAIVIDSKIEGHIAIQHNTYISGCKILGSGVIRDRVRLYENSIDIDNFLIADDARIQNSTIAGRDFIFKDNSSCNRLIIPHMETTIENLLIDGYASIIGKLKIIANDIHIGGFVFLDGNFHIEKNGVRLDGIIEIKNQKRVEYNIQQSIFVDEPNIVIN